MAQLDDEVLTSVVAKRLFDAPAAVEKTGAPDYGYTNLLISKSSFLSECQCKKLFWTRHHAPHLIAALNARP